MVSHQFHNHNLDNLSINSLETPMIFNEPTRPNTSIGSQNIDLNKSDESISSSTTHIEIIANRLGELGQSLFGGIIMRQLPIFVDKKKLAQFSISYSFYLEFSEQVIIVLSILLIISGVYDQLTNFSVTNGFIEASTSLIKCRDQLLVIGKYLFNLVALLVIRTYLSNTKIKRYAYHTATKFVTEDNYSVLVKGLPKDVKENNLIEYFNQMTIDGVKIITKNVILINDIREVSKLHKQRTDLKEELDNTYDEAKRQLIELKITDTNNKIEQELCFIKNGKGFVGLAIVSFDTILMAYNIKKTWAKITNFRFFISKIIRKFKPTYDSEYDYQNNLIRIEDIASPRELIWENLIYANRLISIRLILSFSTMLSIVIAIYSFMLLYGLYNDVKTIHFILGSLSALGLIDLMSKVCLKLMKFESELSSKRFELKFKLFFLFIFLCLTVYYTLSKDHAESYYSEPQMFASELFLLFTILSLYPIIFKFLLPPAYLLWLIKKYWRIYIKKSNNDNRILDDAPEYDFVDGVTYISIMFMITLNFYALFPFGIVIAIVALIINMIIDRYLIIRRYSRSKIKNPKLGLDFFSLFNYDILLQCFSNYVYEYMKLYTDYPIQNDYENLILIMSGLISVHYILNFCFEYSRYDLDDIDKFPKVNYDNAKKIFPASYMKEYPSLVK